MVNRPTAQAESQDLSRGLELKVARRPWNPSLHPRDSKGRFIETGGIARLWAGNLARVVRALPRDRVLVQDQAPNGTYTGRRHSTSARWVTMVARPDGSAPTKNQQKVEEEDARRDGDDRRGLGLSRDDSGDPETPDAPHDVDDEGNAIGDDDGDGPDDGDDQDEPEDGDHNVDVSALPNRQGAGSSRFKDTAAVRQHFLALAQRPGANATALRRLAGDEDLQVVPDGGLVTTRDDSNGRWYLTTSGTGGFLDVGDFSTRREAEAAAAAIHATVRNGHIMPGEFNEPIDFSDPNIGTWFLEWRSTKGEDAGVAITRAVRDFRASRGEGEQQTPKSEATAPAAPTPQPTPAVTDEPDIPAYARAQPPQRGDQEDTPEQQETDADGSGRPAGVPADAEPVDGVDGYWSTWNQGKVAVYGPDGKLIGRVEGSYEDRHATVDGVYIPIANQLSNADQIIARHHLATVDPSKADHVTVAWTTHKGRRIIAIRGTIKDNARDDKAVGAGGKLPWSGLQKARVTTGTWKPATRDRKTADILAEFARQRRNVRVVDEDTTTPEGDNGNAAQQLDEDTKKLRAMSDPDLAGHRENLQLHVQAATTAARKQRARSALQKIEAEIERRRAARSDNNGQDSGNAPQAPEAPEAVQSPQERAAAMSNDELRTAISSSERERGTYGNRRGDALNDNERALYEDRRRRTTESLTEYGAPEDLSDDELADYVKRLNAGRSAHNPTMGPDRGDDLAPDRDLYNDLGSRLEAAETQQQLRKIREIEQRKPIADLTNEELDREMVGLPIRMSRLTAEQQRPLTLRNRAVYDEREKRKSDKFRNRPDVAGMDDEALSKEFTALNKDRSTVHGASREALDERGKAVFDEQNRRAMKGREAKVRRAETNATHNSSYTETVHVDGFRYGSVTYHAIDSADRYGYKVGWNASKGRGGGTRLGAYPTLPEALAAIVDAYDGDPDTEPQRLYGTPRSVWVPKMFFELYQSSRRADSFNSASKERQTLYHLFRTHMYGWSDGTNPLTGKSGKGARLEIPEGLLAEFQRVADEMSREMMLRSTDRELDSSDRSKARSRLASINAALHMIGTERENVRKDGGDDDRKVISRDEMEAQQAALRAALATDDEGADGEHLQPGGQGPLDDVPAAGAGGDDGSGDVLPEQGQGDRDGDSGGRGGAGEGVAGGDGVRGPGRADQADEGGRAGSGPAGAAAGAGAGDRGDAGADAGDAGSAGAARRGVRHVAPRFRPNPADAATNGPLQRAAANIDAIRALMRIERENRPATDKEKRALARWTGWGSVPILFAAEPQGKEPRYQQGGARYGKFEQDHARWAEYTGLRTMLRNDLTPVEWRQASRGTMSMHYTPPHIASAMWGGLKALGFERGDVLEAGSGSGTFFGVSPEGARLTGVELDPTTARIAQAIYPNANVLNENFAETDAEPGTFDAAIGNVPFASVPFGDKRYAAESLHNGFITKELALTRPGGITLLITSRHTLDSKGTKARQKIAQYGDLVGAVRLPAGVFTDAGTNVVTDVLVLRRRADGDEPGDQSWLDAPERKIGSARERVNAYFTEHPEHVLGTLAMESSPYGPRLTVKGNPAKAAEQLRDALKQIAEQAVADGKGYEPHPDGDTRPPVILQTARDKHANDWTGRLYEGDDGQLYQHVNGGNPVPVQPSDGRTDQLRALMQLRDVAAELRTLDRKNAEDERAEKLRSQLRDLHTTYVDTYGPLSKPAQTRTKKTGTTPEGKEERTPTAFGYFRSDPDAGSVLALERWDADKGEPILSRVFTERAAARRQPVEKTDDPKTALSAVVAATGRVDIGRIARLLEMHTQDAIRALGTEIFNDPENTGRYELAGAYLSGAVRDKLAAARKAAEKDPAFQVNVAALEAVQPPERTIGEFTPEMGAHWTPPELVQGFLRDYLGDKTLHVAHDERYGWILHTGKVPQANNVLYGVAADPKKGTKGRAAVEIARAILGHGSLTIYRDDKQKDVDEETSRLVRQKADQMRSEFAKYATADAERLTTLTTAYNKIMNGHVVRSYDGMSPSLDGFTPDRNPHPWQRSGAARMQFERSVVLAHEVGLGKTSTLVMGTQALKASGQIEKPFAVVPDHLAQQWHDEARFLYPNAEVHLITSADLADGRRDATLEWLRANKADLVIFTEPAFGSIKMSPEAQDDYEFRELEALREQLDRQYEDATNPGHPFIVAKIEQRIATVQNRISKNAAPMRTPGQTYWDDLGFDYAVIDEAHRYKGVGFRSKEGGGDPATIRGIDLHQKLTDLHKRRGERATVTLATGTPLSNSITEQYTMLALAAPWILDSYNAGAPDLWAATFGRKTLRVENAPDGSGLRIVERFSEFHNRRAMKTMWGLVADTKRADDVGIPRPKVAGGGPNLVLVDATKDQTARLKALVGRGRAIHEGKPKAIRNRKGAMVDDNMLTVSNEGTSVALDPRLIDAKAPAGNKLKAVADRHVERYHQHKNRVYKTYYGSDEDHPVPGALQMIFLNEGVPGGDNKGGFDAYAELKRQMVAGGIPAEKIAFVQDVKKKGKPEDVAELFRKARDGEISVLIGSSSVAGTGMNAQNRMVSLTHVDLDWGAAQMEQRNGRILRYGNQNAEVDIDIFATKGSLDGWKAGFVASKAEGLVDIQRPEMADSDTRDTVTELDVDYPDYETMEAEIGGNPYMSQLMKARRSLRDLEIDQHNEAAERVRRGEALTELNQRLTDTRKAIALREEALPRIRDVRGDFAMTLGGLPYEDRADAGKALHRQITTQLLAHNRDGMSDWKIVGQFGGLDVGVRTERTVEKGLVAHVGFPDLARSDFERTPKDLNKQGTGAGMITRLENALQKAPDLQEADRASLPGLDEEIALLQSAQADADFTQQIEHARARANLLDDVVGKIADLDKLPEIDESDLDKKLKPNERAKIVAERRQERIPLQAAVGDAVLRLEQFDEKFPEPERAQKPQQGRDENGDQDRVQLSAEEVTRALDEIRPDDAETGGVAAEDGDTEEERPDLPAADPARLPENEEETPKVDASQGGGNDEPPTDAPNTAAAGDEGVYEGAARDQEDGTVTLDQDEIAQQLDAIRPEGVKAPAAMSDKEIADEIVSLMEREMADGELTGTHRTRMAVLETEKDRRAGRTPKPEPKKPEPVQPEGGLFDIDGPEPQAPAVADPNNPLDQPDDVFGTPDMFADHEGRGTSRLQPVQMRNPEDLTRGDRYTDADGRTHTVAEPPQRTGRGRVRIVTSDGEERFYNRDAELRLRYPDEEINDDDRDGNGTAPQGEDTARNETPEPDQQDEQQEEDDTQRQGQERDDERNRPDRDTDTDGASPGEGPEGAGGGPQLPDTPDNNQDEHSTGSDEPDAQDNEDDRSRRRRRRGNSGTGGAGTGAPGGPGLPRLDLPHLPRIPASTDGGDGSGRDGGGPDHEPPHTVADLRNTWRRGDRLTAEENTPERRAFLAQLADNPTLTLSSGGGLVTWTDDTTDGPDSTRQWRFAQARNGGRLGKISVTAHNADEARELADRFEDITDSNRLPIDWHQPLTPDVIAQWRDGQGRPLPEALRAVRDAFQQDRKRGDANTPQAQQQPEPAAVADEPQPAAALPDDLNELSDDDLAAAWGTGLSEADQMRVMEEMDRRDDADKRVRDAIPSTPAADAHEVRRRGEAMDAALGFGTTDLTRRPQTREERLQREFQDLDEARYSAAIDATNGYFFSNASRRLPPVSERDLFSGGALSQFGRWRDYASEELIEWFDNNDGRLTFNQFKQKRRADEKTEREQHEEEQRQATVSPDVPNANSSTPNESEAPEPEPKASSYDPTTPRFGDLKAIRDHLRNGQLDPPAPGAGMHTSPPSPEELREIAEDKNTRLSRGDRLLVYGNRAVRQGDEYNRRYIVAAPGSMVPVLRDHSDGFATRKEALHAANTLEEHVRDTDGQPFPWDAPDAVERARAFRGPDGESLPDTMARVLAESPSREGGWQYDTARADERRAWRQAADDWHRQQEADGYTVLADPADLQAGDEVSYPLAVDPDRSLRGGAHPLGTARGTITSDQSEVWNPTGIQALGSRDYYRYPADVTWTGPDGQTIRPHDARLALGVVRRRPRPSEESELGDDHSARPSALPDTGVPGKPARTEGPAPTRPDAEPEPGSDEMPQPEPPAEPEPIGGQPAHWASVDQLQPGDMARIDGTNRRGRAVTRAGYVLDAPERVTVTRRGRTADEWRTTIGESPDGRTGSRGTVYTPLNASAARAEAPDTAAPGAPASGAQGDVISGDLPGTIATDTRGRGLFPGSHVTGNGDREGTVTGVTDTTVSVRWADGDTDNGVAPTSLTVDDANDRRPAGWTSTGQRVHPGHVVSDQNGALLGPVDEADGDRITVTTAEGTVTRDAADLRVVGEVRDEAPETAPVTGISEPTADEINKGDIVVLDLDSAPTTVEVLDTNRDGDRVTLDYVDTTTGELGAIDMDATAVVHKAEGPNGAAPDLGPDDAPAADDDLTVHEPLPTIDPVTSPTVDPDLTPADRDAIADNGSSPEDTTDAQQAAARLGADLPVTPEQATALAAQLRANADPATTEGRAALRAADHLVHAAGRTAPEGLDRPRPSNAAQIGEGDVIAMPDERRGDEVHVYRVIDVEEGPGGVRSLLLEDENRQWRRRIVHAAMPVWQLPEPAPNTTGSNDAPDPVPAPSPRDPNPPLALVRRQIVADHSRTVAMRIIDEAVAGTEPPGDIHALREQIAQRLTPEALQDARNAARQDANATLNAADITGRDRAAVQQALRRAREKAHERTVRAALRTVDDLEPLPGEPNEDLAQRAAALLRLIPDQVGASSPSRRRNAPDSDGSADATTHIDDAVTALLRQLEEGGVDPADIDALTRLLTAQLDGTRQATAQRIVRRAAAPPDTAQQPGLLARVIALLGRIGRRLIELVKAAAEKIAELWRNSRDRLSRLKTFLRRLVRRVRDWPESRRLARLHAALDLPDVEGESLAARVSHWAGLLPERGRFGQASRRVSWWRPTTWAQLAAGRLPGRSSESRWVPDRASDGGPGLTALRHIATLRAAGTDVDQDVTRLLADALGDDFGGDPHGTLQHADDYVAATERRLLNLQAARTSSTIQDPDVDVEIAAARMEAAAARREWEDLRSRYAAAVPDAVAAALADVRDLGPQGSAGIVFGPDTSPDAERAVRDVQRLIPRDWLATPEGRRLTAVDGDAGRYEPDARRATVADLGDAGVGTAAHVLAQHLAGHLPDLDSAQRAFWFTRTHTGRPGARTLDRTALGRLLAQQQTQTDTGDSLARSLQSVFTGDWYLDDDLRSFLLGLLATR